MKSYIITLYDNYNDKPKLHLCVAENISEAVNILYEEYESRGLTIFCFEIKQICEGITTLISPEQYDILNTAIRFY